MSKSLWRAGLATLITASAAGWGGWSAWGTASVAAQESLTAVTVPAIDPMLEVTPERAAAAETFAGLHHPELAALLSRLKSGGQSAYDNAVRDLFRESERLARLKARDPERYAIELELWKTGSRIQLAAARLAMEDSPALKAELLDLLQMKLAIRTRLLQFERDKVTARLEKLDAELAALKADPSAQSEADLEKLLKSARPRAAQARQKPTAAAKPRAEAPAPSVRTSKDGAQSRESELPAGVPDQAAAPSPQ